MVLCRVCLKEKRYLMSMSRYSNNFYNITGIFIHQADESLICKDCINRLSQAVEFREQAICADDFFKNQKGNIKIECDETLNSTELNEGSLEANSLKSSQENEEKLFEIDDKVEPKAENQTNYLKKIKTKFKNVRQPKVTKQTPFICDFCKAEFKLKTKLIRHMKEYHMCMFNCSFIFLLLINHLSFIYSKDP